VTFSTLKTTGSYYGVMTTACTSDACVLAHSNQRFSLTKFAVAVALICRAIAPVATAIPAGEAPALQSPSIAPKSPVDQLLPWLLDEDQQLRGVPFSKVISDTTGKKVLPFDGNDAVDQRVAKAISAACGATIKRFNAPNSAIQNIDRINEVSSHFEETLRELLNATRGCSAIFRSPPREKCSARGIPT